LFVYVMRVMLGTRTRSFSKRWPRRPRGSGLARRCRGFARRQVEWRPVSLEELVPDDHRVRAVWRFVEGLGLLRWGRITGKYCDDPTTNPCPAWSAGAGSSLAPCHRAPNFPNLSVLTAMAVIVVYHAVSVAPHRSARIACAGALGSRPIGERRGSGGSGGM
jgi:hypothetical protein